MNYLLRQCNHITVIMILVTVSGLLGACGQASGSAFNAEIKIGVIMPLSGDDAPFFDVVQKRYDQVVAELNANGGLAVRGQLFPIRLIYADSAGQPEIGVEAVQQLIDEEEAIALLGPHRGGVAEETVGLANDAGIPMIIPVSSTSQLLTAEKPYVFQLIISPSHMLEMVARFVYINLGIDKVAILLESTDGYDQTFESFYKELGGQVHLEIFEDGAPDFRPQLTRIRESRANLIFLASITPSVQMLIEQAQDVGITAPFLNANSFFFLLPETLWEIQGSFVVLDFVPDLATEETLAEYAKFAEIHDMSLNTLDKLLISYTSDALGLLFAAIQSADSLEPAEIRNALANTKYYDGLAGLISYDERGIPLRNLIIMQVHRDQFVFYDLVRP